MLMKEINYQKSVFMDWEAFIKQSSSYHSANHTVRDIIYESWMISKKNNVNPFEVKGSNLNTEEFHKILASKRELMDVAHPYMQQLYLYIKNTNCIVALSDEHGNILDYVCCDGDISGKSSISKLRTGSNRSEAFAGTNGIGLCLRLDEPVQIVGAEHYIKPHHIYACSAAPIHNEKGKLIGCLDIIVPKEIIHAHSLGMVCAAVDGIEKGMAMQKSLSDLDIANQQIERIIENIDLGILLIDKKANILKYNSSALRILSLSEDELQQQNIIKLFDLKSFSIPPKKLFQNFSKQEFHFEKKDGSKLNIILSGFKISNPLTKKRTILYTFEALSSVLKETAKNSGFAARYTFNSIIGNSDTTKECLHLAKTCATSMSNVLILGESGTGKELFAQAIHNGSNRALGPFVAINCGAIPRTLIESELFGYEKGSFTGANKDGAMGKFELANGGTIFLDEIGDMPIELQVSLLRVIQNREVIRIGGKRPRPIDVRIISATNVNLTDKVMHGDFRTDLYYRLNIISILLKPLRNRTDDITPLVKHFINIYSNVMNKNVVGIEPDALTLLISYHWPGNTRELENVIERAINLSEGKNITVDNLPNEIRYYKKGDTVTMPHVDNNTNLTLRNYEKSIIIEELIRQKGNINAVSKKLKIPRRTLYRRLEKYQIDYTNYRPY